MRDTPVLAASTHAAGRADAGAATVPAVSGPGTRSSLDAGVLADVRATLGWPLDRDEVLARGEAVPPEAYYFRTAVRFTTGAPAWLHLNKLLAIAVGQREGEIGDVKRLRGEPERERLELEPQDFADRLALRQNLGVGALGAVHAVGLENGFRDHAASQLVSNSVHGAGHPGPASSGLMKMLEFSLPPVSRQTWKVQGW